MIYNFSSQNHGLQVKEKHEGQHKSQIRSEKKTRSLITFADNIKSVKVCYVDVNSKDQMVQLMIISFIL